MTLDARQCRMARAALEIGVRDLAQLADVSPNTIARLERGEALHQRTQSFIRGALEAEGIGFIEPRAYSLSGGAGVRLGDGARSRYADLFESLWTLPDFRQEPAAAIAALTDIFALYLDIIQDEHREPDVWERLDLSAALAALAASNPHMAFACLRRGITPPDNQSKDYPIPDADAASSEAYDLAHFRRGLAKLRSTAAAPATGGSTELTGDGFSALGFLSSEIDSFRTAIREWTPARAWFELGDELTGLGLQLLRDHETPLHDNQRFCIATLFVRTHQSHQAALILIERGMIGDARSVLRSAVEGAIALNALAADPSFVDRLTDAYRLSQQKRARVALDPAYRDGYSASEIAEMEKTIREVDGLKAARGKSLQDINWADVAQPVCPDLYQLLYRLLSADGTHATIDALNRHLILDTDQNIVGLNAGPDTDGVVDALQAACLVMLWAAEPFSRAFPTDGVSDQIQGFVQRFGQLVGTATGPVK